MTRKVANPDALISEIAARQHGVVCRAQLIKSGVADHVIQTRVARGRLHRVHQGVFAVGHPALSAEGGLMAAVLAVGRGPWDGGAPLEHWGAAVGYRGAAFLWELLPQGNAPVEVIVSGSGGRARRRGLRVHRSVALGMSEVVLRAGIPVTTPARTIADLRAAHAWGRPGAIPDWELRKAIRQAEVLGYRLAAADRGDRTRSDLELDFLALCSEHRLPRPEVNVRIGRYLVDFFWRDRRLVVETDAYRYHRGRTAFREEKRRDLELRRLGLQVIRLSEQQLNEESERIAQVLATELRAGSAGTESRERAGSAGD
jgi:very-short-patch-repair endonuclease